MAYYKVKTSDDVQALLKTFLAHSTLLFVGCRSGLENPNFNAILSRASERARNVANHHYLLIRMGENLRYDPLITLRYGQSYKDLGPYLETLMGTSVDNTVDVNVSIGEPSGAL